MSASDSKTDRVGQSLRQILKTELSQLRQSRKQALRDQDAAAVHQFRVSLRRMRSALRTYRLWLDHKQLRRLNKRLGRLAAKLDAARDWDVWLDDNSDDPQLQPFMAEAQLSRQRAYQQLGKTLNSKSLDKLFKRIGKLLKRKYWQHLFRKNNAAKKPLADCAGHSLQRIWQLLQFRIGLLELQDEQALHQLRILTKQFRYSLEFFQDLYPQAIVADWLLTLKQLQQCLGGIHDCHVQQQLLLQLNVPDAAPPDSSALLARSAQLKAELPNLLQTLLSREPLWSVE